MNPTISIITPSLNQGRFIGETIESVISQEGDFYIDFIVMDGGSDDGSIEVIRKYGSLLNKGEWDVRCRGIRYRSESGADKGQGVAINRGFELAEGSIVAWLNSDDCYLPGTLSKICAFFEGHSELDVVYGKSHFVDSSGRIVGEYPTDTFSYGMLARFNYLSQPSVFFRKGVLSVVGNLDPDLKFVMDYDLWIRMARRFRFAYLPEFLSLYRLHKDSKTVSDKCAAANHLECLKTVMKHYRIAPFNRVYAYCHHELRGGRQPRSGALLSALTLFSSVVRYLSYNRGIVMEDLKMLGPKKIAKYWSDFYRGRLPGDPGNNIQR